MTHMFESVNRSKHIELERLEDGSVLLAAYSQKPTTYIGAAFPNSDEFLAAVAREFDVTFTANPNPLKVGDVVDRDTAFALPHGSLIEVEETGVLYFLLTDRTVASRLHNTIYNRHAFDHTEKFKIVYIYTEGGNA